MLTEQELMVLAQSLPVLQQRGEEIVANFYQGLFREHPELLDVFNQTNQKTGLQITALTQAIYHLAKNITQLDPQSDFVQHIANKHASLGVQTAHYPIVGKHLLRSLEEILTPAVATPFFLATWAKAYGIMADLFIQQENQLYHESGGGWWSVRLKERVQETPEVVSFYLESIERPLPDYRAGQYITVKVQLEDRGHLRQYSLSGAERNCYRIGVKRDPRGIVSSYLHDSLKEGDHLQISAPFGHFGYRPSSQTACFLVQGVGITPVLPIVHELERARVNSWLFHAVKSVGDQPYRAELLGLHHLTLSTVSQGQIGEAVANDYVQGQIDTSFLAVRLGALNRYDFYICGSFAFTQAMLNQLREAQVPEQQLFCEAFAPNQALKKS